MGTSKKGDFSNRNYTCDRKSKVSTRLVTAASTHAMSNTKYKEAATAMRLPIAKPGVFFKEV